MWNAAKCGRSMPSWKIRVVSRPPSVISIRLSSRFELRDAALELHRIAGGALDAVLEPGRPRQLGARRVVAGDGAAGGVGAVGDAAVIADPAAHRPEQHAGGGALQGRDRELEVAVLAVGDRVEDALGRARVELRHRPRLRVLEVRVLL